MITNTHHFPSAHHYRAAFQAVQAQLTTGHKAMLKAHYHAENWTITAPDLAQAANYENHNGVNLQYARIGELLAHEMEYELPAHADGQPFWTSMLAGGYWLKGGWYWVLHPQVAQALEELGWV